MVMHLQSFSVTRRTSKTVSSLVSLSNISQTPTPALSFIHIISISLCHFNSAYQRLLTMNQTSQRMRILFLLTLDVLLEGPKSDVFERGKKLPKMHLFAFRNVVAVGSQATL